MSFEINIISVAQKQPVNYLGNSRVQLRNELTCGDVMRYYKIWPVFCNTRGILYDIVVEDEPGLFWSFPICDSDFSHKSSNNIPSYIHDDVAYNLTPLIIKNEFICDVKSIIHLLIKSSPVKTILFQTRYQDGDFEVIQGTYGEVDFLEELQQGELMFNVCYVVTDCNLL